MPYSFQYRDGKLLTVNLKVCKTFLRTDPLPSHGDGNATLVSHKVEQKQREFFMRAGIRKGEMGDQDFLIKLFEIGRTLPALQKKNKRSVQFLMQLFFCAVTQLLWETVCWDTFSGNILITILLQEGIFCINSV